MCWLLGLIRQLGEHVSVYSEVSTKTPTAGSSLYSVETHIPLIKSRISVTPFVDHWVDQNSALTSVHLNEILRTALVAALGWCLY